MGNNSVAYCACCEDLVGFRTECRSIKEKFKGKVIKYDFEVGFCNECGAEVSTDIDYASRKSRVKCFAYNALGGKQLRID